MPDAMIDTPSVGLSKAAADRVTYLRKMEGDDSLMLRLTVSGGGCSGFQYGFDFSKETAEDDHVFEYHGVPLVVDEVSLDLLAGSEVDYVEDLSGAAFVVKNPNATSSCGCGSSFAV
jgi:iron-sulfur cluster insertion protein